MRTVTSKMSKVRGGIMNNRTVVEIITEWDIVAARQLGRDKAQKIGFGTVDQARITTAISELARNIYLYALMGEIIIERISDGNRVGIQIIAADKGQGINDIAKVMEDGYSTSGGLGAGLPGVKRLMDDIEIQSAIGKGTVIKTEKWLT